MLKFSPANAKTSSLYQVASVAPFLKGGRKVYSLDTRCGHDCPGAKDCKSMAVQRDDNPLKFTIKDGPDCRFRCFSASQEAQYPSLRELRAHNSALLHKLRGAKSICRQILADLPANAGVIRYHVGGDFFKRSYLQGAIDAAKARPDVLFYAYTKSLPYLVGVELPPNFRVTTSRGGKHDHLIEGLNLREAVVVFSKEEAQQMGLPIDKDDSSAAGDGGSFCLLLHGTQPRNSAASVALQALKGRGSYNRKKKES